MYHVYSLFVPFGCGSLRKVRAVIRLTSGKCDPYQGRLVTSFLQPQPLFYFPQPYVAGPRAI